MSYLHTDENYKKFNSYWDAVMYEVAQRRQPDCCFYFIPKDNFENYKIDNFVKIKSTAKRYRFFLGKPYSDVYLTWRESQCVWAWMKFGTMQNISHLLGISVRTVEFYLINVRRKLNARNKAELLKMILGSQFFECFEREVKYVNESH